MLYRVLVALCCGAFASQPGPHLPSPAFTAQPRKRVLGPIGSLLPRRLGAVAWIASWATRLVPVPLSVMEMFMKGPWEACAFYAAVFACITPVGAFTR